MEKKISEKQQQFNAEYSNAMDEMYAARKEFRKALREYEEKCLKIEESYRRLEYQAERDEDISRFSIAYVAERRAEVNYLLKKFNGVACEMA